MAEKIELAKFDIDTDDLFREATEYKRQLEQLRAELKNMKKDTNTSTEAIVQHEANIKAVNKEYRDRLNVMQKTAQTETQLTDRSKQLTQALSFQGSTIEELRQNNKELNKLRNTANIDTDEGQKELKKLNDALDSNNKKLRENVDEYTQQKINIGNYKQDVREALEETGLFNGALGKFQQIGNKARTVVGGFTSGISSYVNQGEKATKATESASGAMKGFANNSNEARTAVTGFANGTRTMTATQEGATVAVSGTTKAIRILKVALISTGIGAIFVALGVAIAAITQGLRDSESATNKLAQAFAPYKGIIDAIVSALSELGILLVDVIVDGLNFVTDTFRKTLGFIQAGLKAIGFDTVADNMGNWLDRMDEGVRLSRELTEAQQELARMQRQSVIEQSELNAEYERERVLRDDETRSNAERIESANKARKARERLMEIQKEQIQQELLILEIQSEQGDVNTEMLQKQADLRAKIIDLNARNSQAERRDQRRLQSLMNKQNKDAQDQANKAYEQKVKNMQEELNLYLANQGIRKKTLAEDLELQKQTAKRELEILKTKLENKKISEKEYQAEVIKINNQTAEITAEISVKNAEEELRIFRENIEAKIESEKYLTAARLNEEKRANQLILEEERKFLELQLEEGLINEDDYNEAIRSKQDEIYEANRVLDEERRQNEKDEEFARRELEFEQELEMMREENATKFEIEREMQEHQYDLELEALDRKFEQELISQEQYNLQSQRLDKNRADAMLKIKQEETNLQLDLTQGMISSIANLIDQNSSTAKDIAIAQASISMFRGIAKDLELGWPLSVPAIIKDTATGLATIKKITSTKVPSASGKSDVGGGGVSSPMNLPTSSGFQPSGGDISENATVTSQVDSNSNLDQMSEMMSDAVADGASRGTQNGMTELTENQNIINDSQF